MSNLERCCLGAGSRIKTGGRDDASGGSALPEQWLWGWREVDTNPVTVMEFKNWEQI